MTRSSRLAGLLSLSLVLSLVGFVHASGAEAAPASGGYRSRPDLNPPVLSVTGSLPPGTLLLTTPQDVTAANGNAVIYDGAGNVVWTHPVPNTSVINLTRITYKGQPALTWFEGSMAFPTGGFAGHWVVYNNRYQQIGTISAGNGLQADAHDLQISPDGRHAMMTIYQPVNMDMTAYGVPKSETVLDAVLQEVDLDSGAVTWQWSALNDGHIPVNQTYTPLDASIPIDFFHPNSVAYSPDGSTIYLSGRHVSSIFSINYRTKAIIWKLGGKPMSGVPNVSFASANDDPRGQHDVRVVSSSGNTTVLSAYDNGFSFDPSLNRGYGRGVTWKITASGGSYSAVLQQSFDHGQTLWGPIVGSNRLLGSNGERIVSFGNSGTATAYSPSGDRLWEGTLQGNGTYTYRMQPTRYWVAWPAEPPALAMDFSTSPPTAYASWNGATSVAQWVLLAGPDASHLRAVGAAAPTGFETAIQATGVGASDAVFEVEALDSAKAVRGVSQVDPIEQKYVSMGGPNGILGPPQGAPLVGPGGTWFVQRYANGYLSYVPGQAVHEVHGSIAACYTSVGGPTGFLGLPLTDETASADGIGRYNNFQGGAITWTPSTGAHETHGAIRVEWQATGFEFGVLGYPTTNETSSADGIGRYNNFQGGAITWTPSTGAHETHGPIRAEWQATGFEFGVLGYPTSDVTASADRVGSYSNFQGGAISYSPTTGAHETHGPIRAEWAALGFEFGVLGYPTSDVTPSADGIGSYSNFVGGAISYSPTTGAHATYGPIRTAWASQGFEFGRLRYPTTDPFNAGAGIVQQNFQGGSIVLQNGQTTIYYS